VLGPLCGIVASWMAAEAVKLIVGLGQPLLGRMLSIDAWDGSTVEVAIRLRPVDGDRMRVAVETPPAPDAAEVLWITAHDVDTGLVREPAAFALVDVREAWEREIAAIPGSVPIPLSELTAAASLPDGPIVVHCHHDTRARRAFAVLRELGRDDVRVMRGGIEVWASTIDPSLTRY
jgi:Rhodanese-related sulfurtransferase